MDYKFLKLYSIFTILCQKNADFIENFGHESFFGKFSESSYDFFIKDFESCGSFRPPPSLPILKKDQSE